MARPLLLSVQQPVLNEFDSSLSVNIERGKEDGMEWRGDRINHFIYPSLRTPSVVADATSRNQRCLTLTMKKISQGDTGTNARHLQMRGAAAAADASLTKGRGGGREFTNSYITHGCVIALKSSAEDVNYFIYIKFIYLNYGN
jgi:hypothetical protein